MTPDFATLHKHFPTRALLDTAALYRELGWLDLLDNEAFRNTCATRMSLALVKAGMALPGRMAIRAGPFQGARIEPGQARLSLILQRPEMLGAPEKFRMHAAAGGIGARRGIVSFWQIYADTEAGPSIGHIDLVFGGPGATLCCANQCYWGAREVWFWPLD